MKFNAVIIDSNFLINDYQLRSNALQKIVKTKNFYSFNIYIPEVVLDECIGNYKEEADKAKQDFLSLYKHLEKLGLQNTFNKNTAVKKLDASRKKYIYRINEFITSNNLTLLPYPDIKHKDIVDRMYKREIPFTDSRVREKGYKDFLIISSIKAHLQHNPQDNIIILTNNVSDFTSDKDALKKETSLLPIDTQYNLPTVYIARSPAVLFSALSSNLKQKCSTEIINEFNENLIIAIKQRIFAADAEALLDIFGSFIDVTINQESVECKVIESHLQIDKETDILEAKGIIKISLECSFSADNLDIQLKIINDQFVFMNDIKDRIFQEHLPLRGEWQESFSNLKFSKEFLFEYIDFDTIKNGKITTSTLDDLYLSISRL